MMMMMRVSVTSLLLILSIYYSAAWTHVQRQANSGCGRYRIPCPGGSGRCMFEFQLCDGRNECGDNSDEDPENCRASVSYNIRICRQQVRSQCLRPLAALYRGLNFRQVYEKLRNTDLRETCGPVMEAQQCFSRLLSSPVCAVLQSNDSRALVLNKRAIIYNTTVNYVCRENVEALNDDKECMLRTDASGRRLLIGQAVARSCRRFSRPSGPRPVGICALAGQLNCTVGAVSEQCGEETAEHMRALGQRIIVNIGCAGQSRKLVYNFRNCHRQVSSQCLRPLAALYQGLNYRQLLEKLRNTDLRETCGPLLAAQQCFNRLLFSPVCAVLQSNDSRVLRLSMLAIAYNTTVNYVCRENVEALNEDKECLLRMDDRGRYLLIGEAAETRCRNLARPTGPRPRPYCPRPRLLNCTVGAVSEQCGEETAEHMRALGERVILNVGCAGQSRKRSKMMKKEMYSPLKLMQEAFSSLF